MKRTRYLLICAWGLAVSLPIGAADESEEPKERRAPVETTAVQQCVFEDRLAPARLTVTGTVIRLFEEYGPKHS
jgi:hypothetical protein